MVMYDSFHEAFRYLIDDVTGRGTIQESAFGKTVELRNYDYSIRTDIRSTEFEKHFDEWPEGLKKPNFEYGHAFADWILSGTPEMPQRLLEINPFAAKFDANRSDLSSFELPPNFSMFYGPRVHQQIHLVIDELKAFPDTRRAWIQILDGFNDNKLLPALRNQDIKTVEYPCTIGFLFDTEKSPYSGERYLNCTVFMRSQNMVTVWPYDYLIGSKLQEYVAAQTGYTVGLFSGMIGSCHIYERDWNFCRQFLNQPLEWLE
ncbi:thymidylate synthase protein [Rhizobium phage RHph_Y68]|uniref:Thymidylate synthase protein n=1 Tax=Rhizobium phage RHph_Y68 TaxID=2509787 RepID=A0A7S5USC5_9CAUD|nr:thymidylate synthase [Rhizobium phage RHph_Y68]QIG68073.1 thymidylate synthase protein [Rhizobium phage RHph_Y68]